MISGKRDKPARTRSGLSRHLPAWFHGASVRCGMLLLAGTLVLWMLFCLTSMQHRYNLQVGDIAHQTITASKNIEDSIATEQARKAAADKVEASYHQDDEASLHVMEMLDVAFQELSAVHQYSLTLLDESVPLPYSTSRIFTDANIQHAKSLVTTFPLSNYQARVLLRMETESFNIMVTEVRKEVESALSTTIREGQVQKSISNIITLCQYKVNKELMDYIVPPLLNACIRPNMVYDHEATEQERKEARDAVPPVIFKQGQNIVVEGERVNSNQLAMLEGLGLLDSTHYDYSSMFGAALMVSVSMLALYTMLRLMSPEMLSDLRALLVILLVMFITVTLCIVSLKLINVHLAPIALGAMLLTGLLNHRAGMTTGIALTLIVSGLAAVSNTAYTAEMVNLLLTGLVDTILVVQFLKGKPQRVNVVICGALAAVCNLIIMIALGLMTSADLNEALNNAVWSMAGGVLSGLIAVGFQPVFEACFNLATPSKLLELANPNQPILRRLQMEAPGTYHHSIVVANLAEAAAEAIGANTLLARTGAYFHDIGKLKRPLYFKENQRGENPHDRTSAYVSAGIVTAHTSDGLALAQKHHLPPEIQRIISEHHGDTPVMYFYHKALQQADGKPVDIKDFRYNGSRPTTRESAIVMLADTIEAAVRSMSDPTPQAIQRFIERLVRGKIEDGQLSGSPLTLHDIDAICEAFSNVLSGVFHERIEYPTMQQTEAAAQQAAAAVRPAETPAETDGMPEPYNAPMPDDFVSPDSRPRKAPAPRTAVAEAPAEPAAEPAAPAAGTPAEPKEDAQ